MFWHSSTKISRTRIWESWQLEVNTPINCKCIFGCIIEDVSIPSPQEQCVDQVIEITSHTSLAIEWALCKYVSWLSLRTVHTSSTILLVYDHLVNLLTILRNTNFQLWYCSINNVVHIIVTWRSYNIYAYFMYIVVAGPSNCSCLWIGFKIASSN